MKENEKLSIHSSKLKETSNSLNSHSLICSNRSNRIQTPPKKLIEIYIVTLMGKSIPMSVFTTSTIGELKLKIYESEGLSVDNQVILFRDKEMSNDLAILGKLGIQSGSTLKLLIQMNGGPGAPLKTKKSISNDDSVLLLLCRQNDDLFMLEVHMKDGKDKQNAENHLLQFSEGSFGSSSSLLEGIDVLDMTDDFEELTIEEELEETPSSRPTSTFSSISTSTFLSLLASSDLRPKSGKLSTWKSRPNSSSDANDLFKDKLSLLPLKNERPATAISIMRLPRSSDPMILLPKSRPASAVENIKSLSCPSLPKNPLNSFTSTASMSTCTFECTSIGTNRHDQSVQRKVKSTSKKTRSVSFKETNETILIPSHHSKSMEQVECHETIEKKNSHQSVNSIQDSSHDLLEFTSLPMPCPLPKSIRQTPIHKKREIKSPKKEILTCCQCKKRLTFTTIFKCKCEKKFCNVHRYSDRHGCTFDYKMHGRATLLKENPLVNQDKVVKI